MNKQPYRGANRSTPIGGGSKSGAAIRTNPLRSRRISAATRIGGQCGVPRYRVAHMAQPKLSVTVQDRLGQEALKAADRLWPGQGQRAVNRLFRDAINRYLRYLGDGSRDRS